MSDFKAARAGLMRSLQRTGIRDRRVLEAIGRVPRERFVPADLAEAAYEDRALPIGEGQTISQPWVVARMTELLDVRPTDRVLELGTGSGYQAAVLAELAAEVVSAERHGSLAERAAALLAELGYRNVRVVHTDASAGLTEWAPYDRIIVTAATPSIDPALVAQCRPDGRIVAPVGGPDHQELVVRRPDGSEKRYGAVKFVPLLGRGGFRGE
ncbi:MAG TPA: protein-L-isoaspartate(D-aspartate) O-methyltransferase [Candidatus Limnocylindrales bacterium]|nr:protein-L-isoaspartate(D-aspartate) O-methyltransferase [Candidatus Limnocylindrales bacterium]